MMLLVSGLALWTLAHGLKVFAPAARATLATRYSAGAVKGVMALMIVGSVALMVTGYQQAARIDVWTPPTFFYHINNLLMLIAVVVYIGSGIPGHCRSVIRHPQMVGTKIWATAHLLVNGDLASIILFGGLLAWAVVTTIGLNKRDGKAEKPAPGAWWWNIVHLVTGLVAFVVIGMIHAWLGAWPFGS